MKEKNNNQKYIATIMYLSIAIVVIALFITSFVRKKNINELSTQSEVTAATLSVIQGSERKDIVETQKIEVENAKEEVVAATSEEKEAIEKTLEKAIEQSTQKQVEKKSAEETSNIKKTQNANSNTAKKETIKATTQKTKTVNDIDTSFNDTAMAKNMMASVNAYRKENGLSELSYSNSLTNLACVRAKEISENWSHTRPDGKDFYTVFTEYSHSASHVGENLAKGPSDGDALVQAWINSPGHKANILDSQYTKTGIAVYHAGDGTCYVVQIFTS